MSEAPPTPTVARPAIAIVSNSQTPYRLHLHRRIAAEIPQIKLWSLFTHETSNSAWQFQAPEEIGPVLLGKGEAIAGQDKLSNVFKEWRRGHRVIEFLREHDVRFVVMMGYNDAGRLRVIRWCRRHGVPCFLFGDSNIHGDVRGGLKSMVKRAVVTRIVRACSGVFACGTLGKAYFAKYGARADRMFFFPYEPDYALLQNMQRVQIDATKARLGFADGRRRIVYSGRLVDVKRVDLLVEAFLSIATQRPDWDLILVGDGPMRAPLEAKVPADLRSRVKWLGFIDNQETVSAIYRSSDVLVLPSDYEPWALVINEAAAAGLAIVSSNVVGAAAEMVRDGVNGRLFPPGDRQKLVECLLDVTSAEKIEAMKAASPGVLEDWRRRGDPVEGLRQAIRSVSVLKQ
jgi:glycosyltransferase involved in cell wall biosynthesis